jgi:5-formaminoimidazole-4-carboxamide-1-(beta)-D-ribofuranosyl 5'-monophosphate synthetase
MIDRQDVIDIAKGYEQDKIKIGALASHSALDIADGAAEEGFRTVLYCQKGREATYAKYFKARRDASGKVTRGFVDDCYVFDKFRQTADAATQQKMRDENVIFVPNRSFTSYIDMETVEDSFNVPMFGSRNMLRMEERSEQQSYYWLLEKGGLPFPEKIDKPEDIDALVVVKLHHAVKKLERGFFTAASYEEYLEKSQKLIEQGVITKDALEGARIERYVIGPVFNFDFFYSPLEEELEKVELLGVDWRFETSLDGHVRLPADQQLTLNDAQFLPEYTVCGHNSATVRESLLEKAFEMAEKFVTVSEKHYGPGIIGPFCLQTCIDKDPRVGGGTNVHLGVGHPYGNSLYRTNMSTGRRIAMEIRRGVEEERLDEILS